MSWSYYKQLGKNNLVKKLKRKKLHIKRFDVKYISSIEL